jgi:hypothetical protein
MLRSYLVLSAVVFLVAGGVSFVLAYTRKMAALANPSGTVSRETYVVAANGSARVISAPVARGFASYLSGGTFLVWGAMLMLVGLVILAADIRWSYPRPSSGRPATTAAALRPARPRLRCTRNTGCSRALEWSGRPSRDFCRS